MSNVLYAAVKQDQMTPKERDEAIAQNKPYDRIQCALFMGEHSAKLIGSKVSDLHQNVDKMLESQIAIRNVYDSETVGVGPGLQGIAEAIGSKVTFPDYSTPYISEFAVKDYSDIDSLEVIDPLKAGRLPKLLEGLERIKESLGHEVNVSTSVAGPFSTAANLRGTDVFLKDIYRSPEFAHKILRLATDSSIAYVKEAARRGILISICDPTASGTLIKRTHFESFAFPYLKELIDSVIESTGSRPTLHICGNSTKIWDLMAQTGASALSLDDVIDIEAAKHTVGYKVKLIGNIRPTATMYLGTPQDVDRNARECLSKAYNNPKGYVLGLGCGLPSDTPPENIHALTNAARKYGQYPLNPELFAV
ncbi:MAG: uroporphyrinogen-III decarboxylase [Eubacterium sp.]|jgi:uroporphyrinogen decarboxylase|nr:uroporphyrinogen-III decarboxylase [Eubacterium sp.]